MVIWPGETNMASKFVRPGVREISTAVALMDDKSQFMEFLRKCSDISAHNYLVSRRPTLKRGSGAARLIIILIYSHLLQHLVLTIG